MNSQDLELSDLIGMEIALHTAIAILQGEDGDSLEVHSICSRERAHL